MANHGRPRGLHYNSPREAALSRSAGLQACQVLLVAFFIAVISLPLAANLAGRDGADPTAENRKLAEFPQLNGSWQAVAGFGGGVSDWFDDHFGFRASLIRWYGEGRLFGLGVSPAPTVVKGRNGWFFYADDESMTDYAGERPLTAEELANWRAAIVDARDWLRAHGVAYVFMIAPDKHVMYPEELPASIRRVGRTSRMDQVLAVLNDAGVATVDVRPALEAAKQRERIFHRTDTHWNDRGAIVAYQQLIDAVRTQLPPVPRPWTRDDFDPIAVEGHGMDLAGMMGLTRVLCETDLQLVPKRPRRAIVVEPAGRTSAGAAEGRIVTTIPGSTLPSALVVRDSFFSRLAPFVAEHFGRTVFLWQNDFDPDDVLKEHPNVVIQEIVGRHLYNFVPSPELVPR